MCWSEKCCFCVPLGMACYLIGIVNLVISLIMSVLTLDLLVREFPDISTNSYHAQPIQYIFNVFELSKNAFGIIMSIVLVLELLHLTFTILFVLGLMRSKPSLVLSFFGFSIMATMMMQIGALLLLIHNYWISALVTFIISLTNVHFSVVVHTAYENMVRGRKITFLHHRAHAYDDEDPILDEFDDVDVNITP